MQLSAIGAVLKTTIPHAMSSVCNTASNKFSYLHFHNARPYNVILSSRVFRIGSMRIIDDIPKGISIFRNCLLYQNLCFFQISDVICSLILIGFIVVPLGLANGN